MKKIDKIYWIVILVLVIFYVISSFTNDKKDPRFELLEVTYKKGWIEGYNAMVEVANSYDEPISDSAAYVLYEKDSLAFVEFISDLKSKYNIK